MRFTLRFQPSQIKHWADRYSYPGEQEMILDTNAQVQRDGFLTKRQMIKIGLWKSPRIKSRLNRNTESDIEESTRIAFSAESEMIRIGVLMLLSGVGWPVASVILHLCHKDRYPILDYRALWSLQTDAPSSYTLPFWLAYTEHCRQIAQDAGVDMRTLDRALWQYSKEQQR